MLQASYVDYKYGRKTSDFEAATDWEYVEWQVKVTHIQIFERRCLCLNSLTAVTICDYLASFMYIMMILLGHLFGVEPQLLSPFLVSVVVSYL